MNNRFKFRCWIDHEFTNDEYGYSVKHCQYYVYSSMVWDGEIVVPIEDVQQASGLNDDDFNYYLAYLDDRVNEFDYAFFDGIIEQCTGAKDRNGNLIYEGDILEDGDYRCVVKWNELLYGFDCYTNTDKRWLSLNSVLVLLENCVIIGNIHENPELLGETDDR